MRAKIEFEPKIADKKVPKRNTGACGLFAFAVRFTSVIFDRLLRVLERVGRASMIDARFLNAGKEETGKKWVVFKKEGFFWDCKAGV